MESILRRSRDGQNSPGELRRLRTVICSNPVSRSLEEIEKRSHAILEKKLGVGFLDKTKDSQDVVSLVDELRNAIVVYQVGEKHVTLPSVNVHGTALAAAVNVQSDWKTGGRSLIPIVYLNTDKIPRLPLTRS